MSNSPAAPSERVVLGPEEQHLIAELEAAMAPLQMQMRGALMMAVRSRGLKGLWTYRDGALYPPEGGEPAV